MRKQSTFSARKMLLIVFMRQPGTGLSFGIRTVIHATVNAILQEETGLDPHSEIQFFIDYAFWNQSQGRTLITRH